MSRSNDDLDDNLDEQRPISLTDKIPEPRENEELIPISIYKRPDIIGVPISCAFRHLHPDYVFSFAQRNGASDLLHSCF